jgi:nickel transport protein
MGRRRLSCRPSASTASGRRRRLPVAVIGGVGLWLFLWSAWVAAHAVWLQSSPVAGLSIQAQYETGEPLREAQVTVFAPEQPRTPWKTGLTDDQGQFRFVPDPRQAGIWSIRVRQAGHGAFLQVQVGAVPLPLSTAVDDPPGSSKPPEGAPVPVSDRASALESDRMPALVSGMAPAAVSGMAPAAVSGMPAAATPPLTWGQRLVLLGSVVWGCIGTALFFMRRRVTHAHS